MQFFYFVLLFIQFQFLCQISFPFMAVGRVRCDLTCIENCHDIVPQFACSSLLERMEFRTFTQMLPWGGWDGSCRSLSTASCVSLCLGLSKNFF